MTGTDGSLQEEPDQYDVPTAAILQAGRNDSLYSEKIEAIPGGIRILDGHRGHVTDYLRTGEYAWDVNMWDVLKKPHYDADADLGTLRLVSAVLFSEMSPPAPDYRTAVLAKGDHPQQTGTIEERIFSDLLGQNYIVALQCKYQELSTRIPGLTLLTAGGAVPFQAEGIWDGYDFYFRYRSGSASLRVGAPDNVIGTPLWNASMEYGHYLDGSLNTEEFIYLFCTLASNLQKAHYLYTFYHKDRGPDSLLTIRNEDGTEYHMPEQYLGWGMNPWDARRWAYERNEEHLAEYGDAWQRGHVELLDLRTDTVDTRQFPLKRPNFTVLSIPEPTTPRVLPDDYM